MAKPRDLDKLDSLHRLWFLILAQGDFGQCAKAARIALAMRQADPSEDGRFTFDTMAECAVVRYARPFGRCILPQTRPAGQKRPPQLSTCLPVSVIGRTGLPDAMSVHEAAIRLRDQFYAHSDAQEKGMRVSIIDAGGYAGIQAAAATRSVGVKNLERLERLARKLAADLVPDIGVDAHRVLAKLHPHKPPEIGQSFVVEFNRGAD